MKAGHRDVNVIQRILRNHGLRATPQRLAVGGMVLSRPVHVTARAVWEALRKTHPAISMNTVYQTLGQFEAKGLLQRLEVGGVTVFDSNTTPHDHACCESCGAIEDVPAAGDTSGSCPRPPEEGASGWPAGWKLTGVRRVWLGLCPACRALGGEGAPPA